MTERPLRILLLGDASNFHRTLAIGLRRLGHDVTVASDGTGWMDTARDIDLRRPLPGKAGGAALWLKLQMGLKRRFSGHDIVSVCTPGFLNLRPHRIKSIFEYVRTHNGAVFSTALGTDSNYVEECLSPDSEIEYNEFMIHGAPAPMLTADPEAAARWLAPELKEYCDYFYARIDGAVSCLWEYDVALRRVLPPWKHAYGGIPIDTRSIQPVELPDRIDKVRLFLGRHAGRLLEKGTDLLEAAAKEVVGRHPDKAELVIVENRPYDEYLGLLRSSHVVLDQLYSYTPATNALLAMAMGLNTVSGGDEKYYRFIGEEKMRPVIHVEPDYDSAVNALERTVLSPHLIRARGLEGRRFVEKHNDTGTVAMRNIEFWKKHLTARHDS